jgi:class 3 adenylate cyclase/tetratricopeptide (TPR) repeat protein
VRKTVTVVFCDVVGSTALGESVDPEALRTVLARYFNRMREIIERHGGTVEKFIGDAVVAVFGVPVVHEDDALRACRTAIEMRDVLPQLDINCRIGVNTGEVITTSGDTLATGDAMNVAARLEQAAEPGEVVIGEATHAIVGNAVVAAPLAHLQLKGKSQPVVAFRLDSVLDAPERDHTSRFVGRGLELAQIVDAWNRVTTQSRCELVTVVGDAGVGKSRLVGEALATVQARVVSGRCLPYGEGITYWPVVEVIKQLAALPSDAVAAMAIRSLLGESDATRGSDEIAWAFQKLLEEHAPLVVVFDDLQWGEETFLDLVESTALLSAGAPLLLLCMARPALVERRPGWPPALRLAPLSPDHADELLGDEVTGDLRHRIARTAGGNPLFISEMLAMAVGTPDVEVPPTLKALLAARLDQLAPAERTILERGAVEGEIFHRGAVQALAPDETQMTTRLAGLVRRELIRPEHAVLAGEDGYRFRHLLVRDAAYDALPKAVRADLHTRFANWLDEHGRSLVERDEIVAYHLEQAARYLVELGRRDPALSQRAAERLAAAGRRAYWRLDLRAAQALLERALALRGPEVRLLVDLALSHEDTPPTSLQFLERAVECAEADGDPAGAALARALEARARLDILAASVDEQEQLALAALPLLEAAGDHAGLSAVWVSLADGVYNFRGRFADAEYAAEQGIRHGALAGRRTYPYFLPVALHVGPRPAADALRRLDELAADYPHPGIHLRRAVLLAMLDQVEEARTLVETNVGQVQDAVLEHRALPVLAEIEELHGNDEAAAEFLRILSDRAAEHGGTALLSNYAPQRGRLLCALGRYDEAERLAAQGRELGDQDDAIQQALWRQTASLVHAHRGEHDDAARLARKAVTFMETTDSTARHGNAVFDLGVVLESAGQVGEAAAAYRQALELYERKGVVPLARRTRERLAQLRPAEAEAPQSSDGQNRTLRKPTSRGR